MKIRDLFEDYDAILKKHRTVEIRTTKGQDVYLGLISNIPENILEKQYSSWSTLMDVKRVFKNRFDVDVCDEDREMASVSMYISIFIEQE